jgi:hypothetical protein
VEFSLLRRGQVAAAVAATVGAIALAGTLPASAATAAPVHHARHKAADHRARRERHAARHHRAGTDWVHAVVLVNCQHRGVILPRAYILTCADAGDYLTGLRWVSWRDVAYGAGTEKVNSCVPSCAAGHFRSYHVLITLWRARPRGHGTGQLKFTRLTEIYTGSMRPARLGPHGKLYHPLTYTWRV